MSIVALANIHIFFWDAKLRAGRKFVSILILNSLEMMTFINNASGSTFTIEFKDQTQPWSRRHFYERIMFFRHLIFFAWKFVNRVLSSAYAYFPKFSFVIWYGVYVVRTRVTLRQKSWDTTQFTKDFAGAKHISLKNSLFGEQLVWAEYENNCCKTSVKDLL